MPKKGWGDLVPDFKKALAQGTKNVADKVTIELKEKGPYWTGQFEQNWYIETGDVVIGAFKKDETEWRDFSVWWNGVEYPEPPDPAERVYTQAYVPEPDGLKGYTIGNVMDYRDEAMDIVKSGRRHMGTRRTAPDNWFTNYVHGPMIDTVGKALDTVMRNEKFL